MFCCGVAEKNALELGRFSNGRSYFIVFFSLSSYSVSNICLLVTMPVVKRKIRKYDHGGKNIICMNSNGFPKEEYILISRSIFTVKSFNKYFLTVDMPVPFFVSKCKIKYIL